MPFNDQLDQNAADLRDVERESPKVPAQNLPVQAGTTKNLSRSTVILAVGITIGIVVAAYFFFQRSRLGLSGTARPAEDSGASAGNRK